MLDDLSKAATGARDDGHAPHDRLERHQPERLRPQRGHDRRPRVRQFVLDIGRSDPTPEGDRAFQPQVPGEPLQRRLLGSATDDAQQRRRRHLPEPGKRPEQQGESLGHIQPPAVDEEWLVGGRAAEAGTRGGNGQGQVLRLHTIQRELALHPAAASQDPVKALQAGPNEGIARPVSHPMREVYAARPQADQSRSIGADPAVRQQLGADGTDRFVVGDGEDGRHAP